MARYAKRLGDLCLLAGAPQDAKEHYEVAISTGRSVGEYVFVACAHEGLASSVLLEVAALESGSAAAFTERYDQYGPRIVPACMLNRTVQSSVIARMLLLSHREVLA